MLLFFSSLFLTDLRHRSASLGNGYTDEDISKRFVGECDWWTALRNGNQIKSQTRAVDLWFIFRAATTEQIFLRTLKFTILWRTCGRMECRLPQDARDLHPLWYTSRLVLEITPRTVSTIRHQTVSSITTENLPITTTMTLILTRKEPAHLTTSTVHPTFLMASRKSQNSTTSSWIIVGTLRDK